MKARILILSGALVVVVSSGVSTACARHSPSLLIYGRVPEFTLTSQDGAMFDSRKLNGNVWVADFIFTSCGAVCPMITSRMSHVQRALRGFPDVRFVSFTVDPDRDTPEQLSLFAAAYRADVNSWFFLTGSRRELDELGYNVFKLNHVDGNFQHSTRLALVDRHFRIRGYYDSLQASAVERLVSDIRSLREAGE